MPCRCDDFEPTYDEQQPLRYHEEHTSQLEKHVCRLQAILAKLYRHVEHHQIALPADLTRKVKSEIGRLAAHKRKEVREDIAELEKEQHRITVLQQQIAELGGDPKTLDTKLNEISDTIRRLKTMTDDQLIFG